MGECLVEKVMKGDLVISGSGSAIGGQYHEVKISGNGKIKGDVDCSDMRISGHANVIGNVKAEAIKVSGATEFTGSIEAQRMKVYGSAEVGGNLACKEIKLSGSLNVEGNVTGDVIDVHGGIAVKGDCAAERFIANGSFAIEGMLNAGSIELMLHFGPCKAREIGGEIISVKRGSAFGFKRLFKTLFQHVEELRADSIEGDDIYLEDTKAKVVRGNNVNIGPGCEIDLVEYKNEFQLAKGVKVKNYVKV